jgi:hypothetical protein
MYYRPNRGRPFKGLLNEAQNSIKVYLVADVNDETNDDDDDDDDNHCP